VRGAGGAVAARATLLTLASALVSALAPAVVQACAVCAAAGERNRLAFFWSTIFLSLLPLGMFGAGGLWLRRQMRAGEAPGIEKASDGQE
jgi:hypothetical protein